MRPVNLIPVEERRGASRSGADRPPIGVYVVLGALGAVMLAVLALVLTNNQINSKTEDLSKVEAQEQGVKQVADALRPFGQFAQVHAVRKAQIDQLAATRFNWEGSLRQLSRAIPSNVWLLNLAATVSPSIEIESAAGGGAASLRDKFNAPAIVMSGCTFSQHAVARMMTRMQNLDDVTDVELAKSARKDEATTAASATAGASASASDDQTDCIGSERVTQFDILVVFGGSPLASAGGLAAGATGDAAGTPNSTAQNAANAQSAVSTANGASSAAAGSSGGTP
jgi:Tfp pilus assembly protein PilN